MTVAEDRAEFAEASDCAVQAVTHLTELPYAEVHERFKQSGRKFRDGTPRSITDDVLEELGYQKRVLDSPLIGTSVGTLRLPGNRKFLVGVEGHVFAYVNGRNEDNDPEYSARKKIKSIVEWKKVGPPKTYVAPSLDFNLDHCVISEETKAFLEPHLIDDRDHIRLDMDDDGERFTVQLVEKTPAGQFSWASSRAQAWANETPGAKGYQVPGTKGSWYLMSTGLYTVLRIVTTFPEERIIFESEEAKVNFEYTKARFFTSEKVARITYDWQQNKVVPKHSLEMHPDLPLSPYQQVGAHLAHISPSFAFFMEQGTGKTATSIAVLCNAIKEAGEWLNHLVICPRNVVYNWQSEIEVFGTRKMKIGVLRGLEHKRIETLALAVKKEEPYEGMVCITNYETAVNMMPILQRIPWHTVVLDESHSIASHRTKRTKAMLKQLRPACQKRLILTGTPIANTPLDLWTQFEFLGPAVSGFSDFKSFSKFFGKYEKDGESGFEKLVGIQHAPLLKETMARNAFVIRKREALPDLPDKLFRTLEVEMSPAQANIYQQLATQLAVEIEDDLENSSLHRAILIQNVLTKLLRLAQVTSGHVVWDPVEDEEGNTIQPKRIEHFTDAPRMDVLVKTLKEKPADEKTIVWSCWVPCLDAMEARFKAEGINYVRYTGNDKQRKEVERKFNEDPECKVFIGNAASGGVGLNLLGYNPKAEVLADTDATEVIYYAMNWSAVKRSQSEDRAHRRGARRPVTITTMVVPETIDTEIYSRVRDKQDVALEISDIRAILTSILGDD